MRAHTARSGSGPLRGRPRASAGSPGARSSAGTDARARGSRRTTRAFPAARSRRGSPPSCRAPAGRAPSSRTAPMNPNPEASDTPVHGLFSPEGVRLDLPIAGPGLRILAYAIDLGLILFLLAILLIAMIIILPAGNFI